MMSAEKQATKVCIGGNYSGNRLSGTHGQLVPRPFVNWSQDQSGPVDSDYN